MNTKNLSERDICTKFITPAVVRAGWDLQTQIREEVSFTAGRRRVPKTGATFSIAALQPKTLRRKVAMLNVAPEVHLALISPVLRRYFSAEATGASSTMPKINQSVLLDAPVPLPPVEEQCRIVAKVDEIMLMCGTLTDFLNSTIAGRHQLMGSLLRGALLYDS